ncbi:MAG: hypothetical protein ABH874_00665 [Methanobacteriota archaeon]
MNKKILSTALLALLLLGSIAYAQPFGKEKGVPPDKGKPPRPHLEPVLVGHGFALASEEFHVLSVNVIKARVLPSRDIREFLKENKTLEEIREELEKNNKIFVYRGNIKFAAQHYALNITRFDNTTLDADILKLPPRELGMRPVNESIKTEVVGHISTVVMDYEGSRVGTGTLKIDGKSYSVLLNIAPPRKFPGRGPPEGIKPPMKERS